MSARPSAIVSALVFPTMITALLGLATFALSRGLGPALVVAGSNTLAALLMLVLERVHTYRAEWLRSRGDEPTDLAHVAVAMVAIPLVVRLVAFSALAAAASWITRHVGFGLWPSSWPVALQIAFGLVVSDFFTYWAHRLMHTVPALWKLHATHHSALRLYWLNAARFHPLDTSLLYSLEVVPLLLLGCPEDVFALFLVYIGINGMFKHCNVAVRLGLLNWVFNSTELHRWHHSRRLEDANTNYSNNLALWDLVFGSYFLPRDREPPTDVGLADLPEFPQRYLGQLLSPWRWAVGARRAGASDASVLPMRDAGPSP